VLKKSVAWGRNRKHNRIERSPERNLEGYVRSPVHGLGIARGDLI
jgi:hypothetical protein